MVFWIASATGLAVAYLFGSLPTGYLAGRLLKGVDLRQVGSGSTGATNVLRTLGPWPGLVVFMIDVLKGAAAIVCAGGFYPWLWTLPSITPPAGSIRTPRRPGMPAWPGSPRWWGTAVRSG